MTNNSSTAGENSLDSPFELPILWDVIYLVESFVIILGNSLSIVVFWRKRRTLRQTSYLLINLAVADLVLGICTMAHTVARLMWPWEVTMLYTMMAINVLPSFASIFSLTLVSLETAYAMVLPLRHRTISTHGYRCAVTSTWLVAFLPCVMWILLPFYQFSFFFLLCCITVAISGVCLITMSLSYLLIYCSVSAKRSVERQRRRVQGRFHQRTKLAVTLSVVTVLSLLSWIPGQLAFLTHFIKALHSGYNGPILFAILLSNSFLNPLVYIFRLPEFRREIKLLVCKNCAFRTHGMIHHKVDPLPSPCYLVSMTSTLESRQEEREPRSSCGHTSPKMNGDNPGVAMQ